MTPTLSIIIPTIGRDSLWGTLNSLPVNSTEYEAIVVADGCKTDGADARLYGPHRDYGATARNVGLMLACGTHIAYCDDDDCYFPGALDAIRGAIQGDPGALHIFRMRQPSGRVLWEDIPDVEALHPVLRLRQGNVGTPMLVHPRLDPPVLWDREYNHDFRYAVAVAQRVPNVLWHETIICEVGHVPPPGPKP